MSQHTTNSLAVQCNPVVNVFDGMNLGDISTITAICETLQKIKAIKPLIKLLDDIQTKKLQVLQAEIAIAKKAVKEFPYELKQIYRSDNRITIAKFWAAQTESEIEEILRTVKCIEFTGTYREYVGEENEKRTKKEVDRIRKSGEIYLIEQEIAEQLAREKIQETIREEKIAEIEKDLEEQLAPMKHDAERIADLEYQLQYQKAVEKVTKDIPRDIKSIKGAIRIQLKKDIEHYNYVDIEKVVREVVCTQGFRDIEFAELFHNYAANYIRQTYDVCSGAASKNRLTYYLWDYATEQQRRNDVCYKISSIRDDLKRLSKRSDVRSYMPKWGIEKQLGSIVEAIQQENQNESELNEI